MMVTYTGADMAFIIAEWNDGKTSREIADCLGRNRNSVLRVISQLRQRGFFLQPIAVEERNRRISRGKRP